MMDKRGRPSRRCRQHRVTDEYYRPQLWRLLRGKPPERLVYDSLVDDVVGSINPLELFDPSQQRPGILLIEALYRTHAELVDCGDEPAASSLAPLGYARWVAWRRFGDAVRDGSARFNRGVGQFIVESKRDVASHLHSGWMPSDTNGDVELVELLDRRWGD